MVRGKAIDLTGQRFGHLTVISRAESDAQGNSRWLCHCDCGNEAIVRAAFLKRGQVVCSKSCVLSPARQIKDISGHKFGELTAIKHLGFDAFRKSLWLFRCSCGSEIEVPADRVLNSGMKSCGKGIHVSSYKHGLSRTRGYKAMHFQKYMGAKSGRTPDWLTEDDIEYMTKLYIQAKALSESTGKQHEVDHIYPLQGKKVSGLHVPANLRIVTRSENRRKTNKLIDDESTD